MSQSTVYFVNESVIDLAAIAVMGVSVKEGPSPIGYFGTGLKFALATLLRTGHEVRLTTRRPNDEVTHIEFVARPEVIRGETFQRVHMLFNGGAAEQPLGFTTQLGRNWEVWQAYRELACNTMDEGGSIASDCPPGQWGTNFCVTGDGLAEAHRRRREVFLEGTPSWASTECEVHRGGTTYAFYRGVRAHQHNQPALFTYNITDSVELTEDRTVKYGWEAAYYAERAVADCPDEDLIEQVVMAPKGTWESQWAYTTTIGDKPSPAFMAVLHRLRHNAHCNLHAVKLWETHARVELTYEAATLDAYDEEQLAAAMSLIARLGAEVERSDFIVVEGLGQAVYGRVRRGQILIARATLDMGVRFIASTLYEEWLHATQNMSDMTRPLQNLLFEKLLAMTERVVALEARA